MLNKLLILILSFFLLFSCTKKNVEEIVNSEPSEEEQAQIIYREAVDSLKKGDAFYAAKKFREVEILLPQSQWAAKASLMAAYSDYSRNAYSKAIFSLERFVHHYPADENVPYAHYLIAIC